MTPSLSAALREEKESWSDYVKRLPDKVRVGLAEYVAQSFLDGVEEGRKKEQDRIGKAVLDVMMNNVRTQDVVKIFDELKAVIKK